MGTSRILIIDDDPGLRKTLTDILRAKEYDILTAGRRVSPCWRIKPSAWRSSLVNVTLYLGAILSSLLVRTVLASFTIYAMYNALHCIMLDIYTPGKYSTSTLFLPFIFARYKALSAVLMRLSFS